jgi:hypothetical protein
LTHVALREARGSASPCWPSADGAVRRLLDNDRLRFAIEPGEPQQQPRAAIEGAPGPARTNMGDSTQVSAE